MVWNLYHSNGKQLCDTNGKPISVHSLTYNGEWMGECSVTVSIDNEAPIEFEIGDYLLYRGERFELNYEPGKVKQGRKNILGDSFKYDSVKFNSLSDELARAEFLDVVLESEDAGETEGKDLHYTALPDFVFYIETLDDLLDRLQANMNEQIGKGEWKFYSRNWKRSETRGCTKERWEEIYGGDADADDTGVSDTEIDSTSISIQNQTVWEGLALVESQFDVNFIVRNREVFIGTSGIPTSKIFQYGKDYGLCEINQDADSSKKVTTRMRAYGSEKNLPNRYYATLDMEVWCGVDLEHTDYTEASSGAVSFSCVLTGINVSIAAACFTRVKPKEYQPFTSNSTIYLVQVHDGEVVLSGEVTVAKEGMVYPIQLQILGGEGYDNTKEDLEKFYAAIQLSQQVHFVSGVNKDAFPDNHKDYSRSNFPNNMACSRLMLPGFPKMSLQEWWDNLDKTEAGRKKKEWLNPTGAELNFSARLDRPWIESANAATIGIRPSSVYFDTEDIKEKKEEIYPTIKEMLVDGVRIDEIAVGTSVEDNGVFKNGQTVPSCKVELKKELNFDINMLKQSDFSITMTDGMCAGRTFKVSGSVKENGRWVLTLTRVEDIGLYFPYKDFQINAGDHFVLSGIELPVEYVDAASEKLLKYAIIWLLANDHTRYTYAPKVYDIFMARQHDEAMSDKTGKTKSLHDTLKEGDILQFTDEDFGLNADVIIDKLTIKEEDGKIPTYEISLRDDKEVGTIQKIQEEITAIRTANGGGLTPAQIKSYIESEGKKYFLSKINSDIAQKLIRFWEGIAFDAESADNPLGITGEGVATLKSASLYELVSRVFKSGATGTGFRLGNYGNTEDSYLEVDRLLVRKAAEFVKLVIRELQSVGGEIVLSPAAMKVASVERLTKGVVIQGYERGVPYDIDRCYFLQKDNNGNAVENQFVVNDLVRCQTFNVKTGTSENVRNRYYWRQVYKVGNDFIDVLVDRCDTNSDTPLAGDEIVQFGNTTDKTRQSVILLSAYGDDAPSLKMYYGINSYTFDNKEVFVLSRTEMMALADKFVFKTSTGEKQTFAQLLITMNGLQSTVKSQGAQIGKLDSKITQTAESIVSTVSKTYATKSDLSTLQKEVDENGNDITSARSEIKQTADSITAMVETTTGMLNCIVGSAVRAWDAFGQIWPNRPALIQADGVGGTNYFRCQSSGVTSNTWIGLKFLTIPVEPSTQYTFSIWARVVTATDNGAALALNNYTGATSGASVAYKDLTNKVGDWTLYTMTFTTPSGCTNLKLEASLRRNGCVDYCRPMLQKGDTYCGWSMSPGDVTESGALESASKMAGIDLRSGKVTVTADNFVVQNNDGETTASVNSKGVLEVKNGLFSGFVRKQMTTLTPDNISKYIKSSQSNGYLSLDFVAAGSYVKFDGAIAKKLGIGGNYISPILPFYDPTGEAASLGSTLQEAITYIGQTVVLINQSDTTLNIVGWGTIKGGSSTQTYWIGIGYMAVLTCELVYTSATSYKVVWNGYNIKIK